MILLEVKYYPFLLVISRGNSHTEADFGAFLDAWERLGRKAFRDKTRHVCITVSNSNPSAAQRKHIASRIAALSPEVMTTELASYAIVEGAFRRGILTALRWVAPKLVSIEPVGSVAAAMTGAAAVFKAHGIAVDDALTRDVRQLLQEQVNLQRKTLDALP